MGKHDMAMPVKPLPEALERHYKERIKALEAALENAKAVAMRENERADRLQAEIDIKQQEIKELQDAFLVTAIEAAAAKKGVVRA